MRSFPPFSSRGKRGLGVKCRKDILNPVVLNHIGMSGLACTRCRCRPQGRARHLGCGRRKIGEGRRGWGQRRLRGEMRRPSSLIRSLSVRRSTIISRTMIRAGAAGRRRFGRYRRVATQRYTCKSRCETLLLLHEQQLHAITGACEERRLVAGATVVSEDFT